MISSSEGTIRDVIRHMIIGQLTTGSGQLTTGSGQLTTETTPQGQKDHRVQSSDITAE